MYKQSIGLIGRFGAYATLDFYIRILKVFASESERNFPHIYMENDFTMPSRTKALLDGTDYNQVVLQISASLKKMLDVGADYIVLVCRTAHAFLEDAFRIVPEAENKVLHIVKILGNELKAKCVKKVAVIAAEGKLKNHVYSKYCNLVNCIEYIGGGDFKDIRYFIETIKRNEMNENVCHEFKNFLDRHECKDIVLGCTEFPVLVDYINSVDKNLLQEFKFWDPLEVTLKK